MSQARPGDQDVQTALEFDLLVAFANVRQVALRCGSPHSFVALRVSAARLGSDGYRLANRETTGASASMSWSATMT
jgi:hypothetical protein